MSSSNPLVYLRLHFPSDPLTAAHVSAFLTRVAADHGRYPLVLETHADDHGVQHLIGCEPTDVRSLRALLQDLIPGMTVTGLEDYIRPAMVAVGRLALRPRALPLSVDASEPMLQSLYSTLARTRRGGEAICCQLVLGRGLSPKLTPQRIPDPTTPVWKTLLDGHHDAPSETRNRIRDRLARHAIDAVLRIGVAGDDQDRRARTAKSLLAALSMLETPGVSAQLVRENPNLLNLLPLTRRGAIRLSVPELVALSTWPVSKESLPGMPPAHPKMLRADAAIESSERGFASSLAPGDSRRLTVSAADLTMHAYALGPTGVGKSTLLGHLARVAIHDGRPLVVLDPKGEMHEDLMSVTPKERWKDIVVVDGTEDTLGFNPLDAHGRDPDAVADSILAVFEKVFEQGWGARTADIFSASIRSLTRAGTHDHPYTLLDIQRLWIDAPFRRHVVGRVSEDPALAGFWAWYDGMRPNQQANVIAAPSNKLRQVMLRPAAVRVLGQARPGFKLRDTFRDKKIVLFALNQGLLGPLTVDLILSLAVSEIWQAVQERVADSHRVESPGLVVVDEADRLMNLPIPLADALARSRSMAVGWVLATQYWDQLPAAMKYAVKTNCRTKVVFHLESDDDARTIAKLAPELTAEDFMALGLHEVYLRLTARGIATGWALGKTLPPSSAISDPAEVLHVSRRHHQPEPATAPAPAAPSGIATTGPMSSESPVAPSGVIGRRRRAQP